MEILWGREGDEGRVCACGEERWVVFTIKVSWAPLSITIFTLNDFQSCTHCYSAICRSSK